MTRPQAQASGYDLVRTLLLGTVSFAALAVAAYAVAWHAVGAALGRRRARPTGAR